ncbi:legionaminic acid biosynthesis protein PtmG [Vibrio variabilis]|uniref:Legionaminic acid biosynthesis protein PtmG n=1 Tax=Vibrio variabilis TaxID=990271 RepID=A0ABQ0JFJ7_9VIBR|nr:legionaminic acid biosynthesis protein PtmG [Vibrio variabilis]
MGYYLKWDPQECYYYAADNTGFEANTERTEARIQSTAVSMTK